MKKIKKNQLKNYFIDQLMIKIYLLKKNLIQLIKKINITKVSHIIIKFDNKQSEFIIKKNET